MGIFKWLFGLSLQIVIIGKVFVIAVENFVHSNLELLKIVSQICISFYLGSMMKITTVLADIMFSLGALSFLLVVVWNVFEVKV